MSRCGLNRLKDVQGRESISLCHGQVNCGRMPPKHALRCGIGVPPYHLFWDHREYGQFDLHC
jgi:hypothetical protein